MVWPILYFLMAIALGIVWLSPKCWPYCEPIAFFIVQLALNLIWTTLFFKLKRPVLALLDIVAIIALLVPTMRGFAQIDRRAYWLLVPYAAWLLFALYLTVHIVIMN
jgi:tryptophan-rich sensory protein